MNRKSIGRALAAVLVVLLPCRFLLRRNANYYIDWYNHQWVVGYFGEFFRHHFSMPAAFNTPQVAGMAGPVFYGSLGYPLLGLFSSVFAPGVVVRLAAIFLFAAQYRVVTQALDRLQASRFFSRTVACLVIWTIYPLTNLYNRAALTEFFATGLLTCAIGLLILFFHARSRAEERRLATLLTFCLVTSAGTHPITALFGAPFFALLGVYFWRLLAREPARRAELLRAFAPWAALGTVCLAPWLYAVARYSRFLAVRNALPWVAFDVGGLDHWLTRFYLIPWDRRVKPGISLDSVSTPYLDSQINMPLLMLLLVLVGAAWFAMRPTERERTFLRPLALPIALFAFFTWISLSPESYHYLPAITRQIQCAYRAVTYQNLALLLAVFLSLMAFGRQSTAVRGRLWKSRVLRAATCACLLLSGVGIVIKWSHIHAIARIDGTAHWVLDPEERKSLIDLPPQYYGRGDYTAPDLIPGISAEERAHVIPVNFKIDAEENFGDELPMTVSTAEPGWVGTNVQVFPWSRFRLDGREVASADLRNWDWKIAVRVPPGRHTLEAEFVGDALWRFLRVVSLLGFFGWCGWLAFSGGLRLLRSAVSFLR